ncbi:hypothetical protein D3C87_1849500 [compost metagenome]
MVFAQRVFFHHRAHHLAYGAVGRVTQLGHQHLVARIEERQRYMGNAFFGTNKWQYFGIRVECYAIGTIIKICN